MSAEASQTIATRDGEWGRVLRTGMLLIGIPQLAIGAWALISPSGWFSTFPGAGREWLPLYGPFDEHLVTDVGATFVALGLALVIAAIWLDRRAVQVALIAYLAYALPHLVYHLGADDVLGGGDQVLNGVAIGLATATAVALLALTLRTPRAAAPGRARPGGGDGGADADGEGTGSRLRTSVQGPFARLVRWYGRRAYGGELAPVDAMLHHRRLLAGYGAFETALERSHKLDHRLRVLAETKAAAVVGCEWCIDFASHAAADAGVPERQLRELPLYRDSEAFDDLERLVLEYATAMSRTPTEVTDDLVARLKDHFDDAQLVELTTAIAIENFRARFNDALGLDPQGFSEGAFCVIPEAAAQRDASPLR